MTRSDTSLAVLALVTLAVLVLAPDVFFVIFAGLLFGLFVGGGGGWIADRAGLPRGAGIAIFVALFLAALAGVTWAFASAVFDQINQFVADVPPALAALRARIGNYGWVETLLSRAAPGVFTTGGSAAATALTSTFGALGSLVIVLFVGLYGAIDPRIYRRGLSLLVAPSLRPRVETVIDRSATTLRRWMVAQLMSMSIVGGLTGLGLWLAGIPLAALLGIIAGLLAFIPNIGPILAALPAVLLASSQGGATVLTVIGIYIGVQALETYVITPRIQQERVSLPPALIIGMQLLLGALFGLIGLTFATPLTALGMTLVNEVYRRDYLERERAGPAAAAPRPNP